MTIRSFVVRGFSVHAHTAQSAGLSCHQSCIQDVLCDLRRSLILCACTSREREVSPFFPFLFFLLFSFFPLPFLISFFSMHSLGSGQTLFAGSMLLPVQHLCPSCAILCSSQASRSSLLLRPSKICATEIQAQSGVSCWSGLVMCTAS